MLALALAFMIMLLTAPPAGAADPLLRRGDRGAAVMSWQTDLNRVAAAGLRVDGVFGPLTDRATRRFQSTSGLVADGVVGPLTRRAVARVPVRRTAPSAATAGVAVFFSDRISGRTGCTAVARVERRVPAPAVLRGALEELLEGPTPAELQRLGPGVLGSQTRGLLREVHISQRVAYVDFSVRMLELGALGSSCGSSALVAQLNATTRQFATVDRVVYSVGGKPCDFQELIGAGSC